jgi:hypothetical protein
MTPQQALNEQAQAERTAGKLLTQYVFAIQVNDRSRILAHAIWEAGAAATWGAMAERLESEVREKPRGTRR